MYKDSISVFENFYSKPKTITLNQWIKACKYGSRFTNHVVEYRHTRNQDLKRSLPHATVGAICLGSRDSKDVVTRTGWIALDIDRKDNPYLTNAEHLRDEVAKISNIAFTCLSTGGEGVWALIKVANPDRQAEHFEMLLKDFKAFGITLDSSKGRNPNDARFISYDPGAIIKDSYTVYHKLPPLKDNNNMNTITSPINHNIYSSNYSRAALLSELQILSEAKLGCRNNALFKCTARLAEFVAGGAFIESDIKQELEAISLSIGLKENEIKKTIDSGFKTALNKPRFK